jgi:hypothetical protein
MVLHSVHSPARGMYANPAVGKIDLSYRRPARHETSMTRLQDRSRTFQDPHRRRVLQPVSVYTVLARYLDHCTGSPTADSEFTLTRLEQAVLLRKGYSLSSVESWAACLLEPRSHVATHIFKPDKETPPFFVLLLVLRRQHVGAFALGQILRHVERRAKTEPLSWTALKILSVRLLRHARKHWPESIPWIADLFATEAGTMFPEDNLCNASPRLLSDITRFSNVLLLLLSLPADITPVLGAIHQEKAQFQILQFMASRTPAITVTQTGFRSVSRNQLAHSKTAEEREWAELKGPSWPPWKEDRTAMDEDKDYEFGASRASKILQRMYEAGYQGHIWEEMVEVYAGWDTDFSPTIQTRTSLPHVSSRFRNKQYLAGLLWSARVRSTRTRREAWACFLAYELSGAPASQQVYLAMFEKLYHSTMKRSTRKKMQDDLDEVLRVDEDPYEVGNDLLPGDMKEVLSDPISSLNYVYLSEPVPSIKELRYRMHREGLRPTHRLLAFLLKAAPTFQTCIDLLQESQKAFSGGVGHLLVGKHGPNSCIQHVPNYLLAAFIECLCRFGRFAHAHHEITTALSQEQHTFELRRNRYYSLEYAGFLLFHYRPHYRPAWSVYMDKIIHSSQGSTARTKQELNDQVEVKVKYTIVWRLVELMEQIDLSIDDTIFQHVCTVTTYAAQGATGDNTSATDPQHLPRGDPLRLRVLFRSLVGVDMDRTSGGATDQESDIIPPHIPNPAALHNYVRALGTLQDYEGLYSFSTWLTKHHAEVSARCKAQNSGKKLLFKTLVALRAGVTGYAREGRNQQERASDDIIELIKSQIESIAEWGGWPTQEDVDMYIKGGLKSEMPGAGGR